MKEERREGGGRGERSRERREGGGRGVGRGGREGGGGEEEWGNVRLCGLELTCYWVKGAGESR